MKIANNTFERYEANGDRVIRLHETDIMTFHKDGTVTLNSGGYRTVTTKRRMNQLLPNGIGVIQRAGEWYVQRWMPGTVPVIAEEPFFDGMTVKL